MTSVAVYKQGNGLWDDKEFKRDQTVGVNGVILKKMNARGQEGQFNPSTYIPTFIGGVVRDVVQTGADPVITPNAE